MKKSLILFILIFSLNVNAQYTKGTIFLKDSTKIIGFIKLRRFSGIKFKLKEDSKPTTYNHTQITGFDILGRKSRYLYLKNKSKPKLFDLKMTGKMSLYSIEVTHGDLLIPNRATEGNEFSHLPGSGISSTKYYVQLNGEIIKIGTKIKKKHLPIFEDCPDLLEKIKTKKIDRDNFKTIVYRYNNCE